MPSKSRPVLPLTPSPTALFTQTAHSRQILTPAVSLTSALLPHSFAIRGKSSHFFSIACALFAKKTGVYPSRRFHTSAMQLLTALDSILTETPSCKPFRMNTQHPTKDADPERPSGAEGFLPCSGPALTTVESILTESGRRKPFRMNTCRKQGEGGRGGVVMVNPESHERYASRPTTCPESSRGIGSRGTSLASDKGYLLASSACETSRFRARISPTANGKQPTVNVSSGLRRRREKSDRQVPRRPQSCRRTQNHRNGIHRHARRRNISVRAARNHERNIRMPRQRNCVRRIFRADVHLQFHVNQFLAAAQTARNLVYARRLPRLDRQKFCRHFFRRHFRFDRFRNFVHGQSQTIRDHRHRLRQTNVLDRSFFHACAKFLHAQSCANLFLQRQSPLRRVHNSQRLRMVDSLRHCAQRNRQLVHHESRIHARSDQRHAPFFRRRIQLRGEFRMRPVWIRKFLARRNHARLCFQARQQLVHHFRQRRRSRVHHYVRRLSQHFRGIRRDFHAPRRVARAHHFAQIASHFCRVVINRADNFHALLLAHQLRNRSSDRANAILNRAYFLFHYRSPLRRCKPTPRILGAKESSKIMDSPRARNARRSSLPTLVQSLRPFLARTIINSPSVPEAFYASAQTHRRRNRETFDPAARLANSKRQTPLRVRVQGFRHRIQQHDARRAHRRIDESPPRVVQRME